MEQCWKYLKKINFFLYILVAWTLLGFSNIWLLPYRTNILVEKIFGFSYNDQTTLLILIVIPQLTYMVFCFPFGKLFDHFNFITMRIFINVLLIFYFGFFFFGTSLKFHILGSFFLGLAYSGGNIAWKMWINKMVPQKKYNALHEHSFRSDGNTNDCRASFRIDQPLPLWSEILREHFNHYDDNIHRHFSFFMAAREKKIYLLKDEYFDKKKTILSKYFYLKI